MLNKKEIKLPNSINVHFLYTHNQRFLVFTNTQGDINMSINIPVSVGIQKVKNVLLLTENISLPLKKPNGFFRYLKNFIISFQVPTKKTLILRGLGLKASFQEPLLSLKLGYSHENIINVNAEDKNKIFIGKKFITILNYNKIYLGNFVEKIFRLKKANCYKGRGLYYKEKSIVTKIVKKT
jgi:ribosomal protein L6P/L9E